MENNVKKLTVVNEEVDSEVAKAISVYTWSAFGRDIASPIVAICELVTNAIDAVLSYDGRRRVDVTIDSHYVSVKNSGEPFADLAEAFNYGYSSLEEREKCVNKKGVNNQYGTGIKNAFSFLWPEDGGNFSITTRQKNGIKKMSSPYGTVMTEQTLCGNWKYEDWCTSVLESFSKEELNIKKIVREIERYYTMLLLLNKTNDLNVELYINGKKAKAVVPEKNGRCVRPTTNPQTCSGASSYQIFGHDVEIDVYQYDFNKTDKSTRYGDFYRASKTKQGVYLYVGYHFVKYLGVSCFTKKNHPDSVISAHDSMNRYITLVNINPTNQDVAIPVNKTKTDVVWESTLGKEYAKIIDDACGKVYKDAAFRLDERNTDEGISNLMESMLDGTSQSYIRQCAIYKTKTAKNTLRPDAFIVSTEDGHPISLKEKRPTLSKKFMEAHKIKKIEKIVEYKNACEITKQRIGQLVDYCDDFEAHYGYQPKLLMLNDSGKFDEDTRLFLEHKRKKGYKIEVKGYNPNLFITK